MTRNHHPRYTRPQDPYPHARCECGHLCYPDQPTKCRWCQCSDHRPVTCDDKPGEES